MVRGYPLDSNVKGHGIRPSGVIAGKEMFVLDAGAVKRDIVANDETIRVGAKGDEAGGRILLATRETSKRTRRRWR